MTGSELQWSGTGWVLCTMVWAL